MKYIDLVAVAFRSLRTFVVFVGMCYSVTLKKMKERKILGEEDECVLRMRKNLGLSSSVLCLKENHFLFRSATEVSKINTF